MVSFALDVFLTSCLPLIFSLCSSWNKKRRIVEKSIPIFFNTSSMKALCTKTDNAQTRQKQSADRGSRWKRIVLIARFWTLISKLKSETCGFPFLQLLVIKITFYIYLKVLKIFYVLKLNFRISFCPCDLEGSKGNELKFLYWVQNSISIFRNNYLYTGITREILIQNFKLNPHGESCK